METTSRSFNWLNTLALFLVLPATFFILISVLKYNLGIEGPFDTIYPWLERVGIQESLGWNINGLILFGPLLAFAIALLQVLGIEWNFTKEQFDIRVTVQRKLLPLLVLGLSVMVLATLIIYLLGENLN